jgi:uncharacterized protein (DUF58 family)
MVLVLGAINGQNNLLFWLFGLGVGGLIVSGVLSGGALMRLDIERETPETVSVGDDLVIRYRVTNRSRVIPAFGLVIEELTSARGGRLTGTWLGRLWAPVAFAPYVPARGSAVVEARVRALRRGPVALGPVRIWTTFPFGLTKKSKSFYQETELLVRPRVAPLRPGVLDGLSGKGEQGATLRKSRAGEEFYSLREYAPGDSLRSVAWRSTARLGYAVVREMALRPSRHLWIVLDLGGTEADVERVLSVAAALCVRAAEAGLEPGLALVGGRVLEPARGGRRHVGYLLDALGGLEVRWAQAHSGELPLMPPAAFAQDAFIVVDGGGAGGALPKPGARRVDANDSAIMAGGPPWSAIIQVQQSHGESIWRKLGRATRAAFGKRGAP